MSHTHDDDQTLTAGCPACVERVRIDQRMASIDGAPLRRCTWTCTYSLPGDDEECAPPRILTFDRDVRVPAGWTGWDVDEEYADLSGDGFLMALNFDTVPARWTDHAVTSMDVRGVHIGPIVPEPKPIVEVSPPLFEVAP